MQHKEWQELIPFYVAQTLPPDEIRRFEAHLANCDSCQHEIDDWRVLASAVWREADDAARNLPPLSQEVYNRLNYRDRTPKSRYSTNPPVPKSDVPDNVRPMPHTGRTRFPLTLVAGIVVAVFSGGLLMALALRPTQNPQEIALDTTSSVAMTQQFAGGGIGGSGSDTPVQVTATSTRSLGIIPTLDPDAERLDTVTPGPPIFLTITSQPEQTLVPTLTAQATTIRATPDLFPPPLEGGAEVSSMIQEPSATSVAPSSTPLVEPPGGGPYITVTPGVFAGGIALCEAFNPTTIPIEIFVRADRNMEISGVIMPGEVFRVTRTSITGWYYVEQDNDIAGWLQPGFAYLRGNCVNTLPIVTVIPSPTRTIGTADNDLETAPGDTVVVINASFADLYTGPDFNSTVIGVAERNQQFVVSGYQGTGTNRWVLVNLPDGSEAWLWASVVTEYPAGEAPPSPTP